MSHVIQSPPEILGSPSLRMILKRIDGLQDSGVARNIPVVAVADEAPLSRLQELIELAMASWRPWALGLRLRATKHYEALNSGMAVSFGGGLLLPLLVGLGFASTMVSGPPLAAKGPLVEVAAATFAIPHPSRLFAFASAEFSPTSGVTYISKLSVPVAPEPARLIPNDEPSVAEPKSDVAVLEEQHGVVALPDQRQRPSTAIVVRKTASIDLRQQSTPVHEPRKPVINAAGRSIAPRLEQHIEPKPMPKAPSPAIAAPNRQVLVQTAAAVAAPAKSKGASARRTAEPWANAWHRSALGMAQQGP